MDSGVTNDSDDPSFAKEIANYLDRTQYIHSSFLAVSVFGPRVGCLNDSPLLQALSDYFAY